MDTIEWRHDGERKVVINFPDLEKGTANQTMATFIRERPNVEAVQKLFRGLTGVVKDILTHDYHGSYNAPDGRILFLKKTTRIKESAVPNVLELCAELGEDVLASPSIDPAKLSEAIKRHPELKNDLQPYLETVGEGTLSFKGRQLKAAKYLLDQPENLDGRSF